jgi:hypothetical protein
VLDWIREAFRIARDGKRPALVLALHADMFVRTSAYGEILGTLAAEALRYRGEVLLVHGDTHWYRFDRPLTDPRSGVRIENVVRLEVFGSPFVDWTRVTVLVENGRARFSAVSGRRERAGAQPTPAER